LQQHRYSDSVKRGFLHQPVKYYTTYWSIATEIELLILYSGIVMHKMQADR